MRRRKAQIGSGPRFRHVLALILLGISPVFAENAASPWSVSPKSRARLVADGRGAGFEIVLAPNSITYWRDPGEAGVPPSFDFSGSENLARAEIDYPAPERIPEPDGSEAFGYRDAVILPIRVTAADPGRPVRLKLSATYGVCEKICLPARAKADLTFVPGGATDEALEAARARAPSPKPAEALGAKVEASGDKTWRLCLADRPRELFVEAPEGFWVAPKREGDGACYALTLQQTPEGGKPPIDLRVTVESETGAAETRVTLGP